MTFKGLHINKVLCPTPFEDQKSNLSKQVKLKKFTAYFTWSLTCFPCIYTCIIVVS